MKTKLFGAMLGAYIFYLGVVALLVWSPDGRLASAAVTEISGLIGRAGAGGPANPQMVEFASNVALFVPMSLMGSWIWPRRTVAQWVLIGAVATCVIEVVQLALLPERSATYSDLIANTAGALLGALLGHSSRFARRL